MRVERRGRPVLALVEKQPRLLTVPHVDVVFHARFAHGDRLGHLARQQIHALLEALQQTRAGVVPRQNPFRVEQIVQRGDDCRRQPVHTLRQGLQNEVVAVPVDDEGRQQIRFAVDEPVCRGIDRQRRAETNRRLQTTANERVVGHAVAVREHADGDLRSIAVERLPERPTSGSAHDDDVARAGACLRDIRAIDPRMTAPKAILASR